MKHTAKLLAVVFCLSSNLPAMALDDTPENRAAQAEIYLQAVPPPSLLNDLTEKVAETLPESQRATFKALMTKNLDMAAVTEVMRQAMVKNFTADELKALGDFYGSPIGKSAMAKMGTYMAEAMTPLMAELKKAVVMTQEQMMAK